MKYIFNDAKGLEYAIHLSETMLRVLGVGGPGIKTWGDLTNGIPSLLEVSIIKSLPIAGVDKVPLPPQEALENYVQIAVSKGEVANRGYGIQSRLHLIGSYIYLGMFEPAIRIINSTLDELPDGAQGDVYAHNLIMLLKCWLSHDSRIESYSSELCSQKSAIFFGRKPSVNLLKSFAQRNDHKINRALKQDMDRCKFFLIKHKLVQVRKTSISLKSVYKIQPIICWCWISVVLAKIVLYEGGELDGDELFLPKSLFPSEC